MSDKKYLKTPGIYDAMIIDAKQTTSKKGDPMLVVTFKQMGGEGGEINAYFVPKYSFMAERLTQLKMSVGLPPTPCQPQAFLTKTVRITVGMQEVKPGKEKINEKTGKPYPPNAEVISYAPVQAAPEYIPQDDNLGF